MHFLYTLVMHSNCEQSVIAHEITLNSQKTLVTTKWKKKLLSLIGFLLFLFTFSTQNLQAQCTPTAVCKVGLVIGLDANGQHPVDPNDIDDGSSPGGGACGIASLTTTPSMVDCSALVSAGGTGSVMITLTVEASDGVTNTCITSVQIQDNLAPVLTCAANETITCNASIPVSYPSTMDNCDIALATPTFTDVSAGNTNCRVILRTWSLMDADGNNGTCLQAITVQDNASPFLSAAPADLTGVNAVDCTSIPVAPATGTFTVTDDCPGAPIVIFTETDTQSGDPSQCDYYDYMITRTWAATDGCGKETTVAQMIDVEDSNAPTYPGAPTIINQTANASCEAVVSLSVTVTDICAATSVIATSYLVTDDSDNSVVDNGMGTDASGTYDVGNYTVTFTAVDPCGNTGTHVVDINVVDNAAPTAICLTLFDVSIPSSGTVTVLGEMLDNGSSDNCTDDNDLIFTTTRDGITPATVGCSDIGAVTPVTVTLTVEDSSGNTATCISSINVVDLSPPAMFCQDITVQLMTTSTTLNPSDIDAGSNDACAPFAMSSTIPATLDCSDIGTNTVTLVILDANGNTGTCTAIVTVEDLTTPTATCQNVTQALNPAGTIIIGASIFDNGSDDNCTITAFTFQDTGNPIKAYSCTDIGTFNQTIVISDPSGNTTTCTNSLTIQDTTSPIPNCQNITQSLASTSNGTVTINASAFDNGSIDICSSISYIFQSTGTGMKTFDCTDIGMSTETIILSDIYSNTSSCISYITLIDDIAPTAICINGLAISLDGNGTAAITTGLIDGGSFDNCTAVTATIVPATFDCTDIGTTTTILTITDSYGNSSFCVATLQIQENTAPVITCPVDVTIDCSASTDPTNTGTATATDNCTTPTISYSDVMGVTPSCQTITRTWTASDGANSSQCTQSITVEDNAGPTLPTPSQVADVTVECTPPAALPIDVADNCTTTPTIVLIVISTQTVTPTLCGHYNYSITRNYSISDGCGNTTPVIQTITVEDTQAPTLTIPSSITVNVDAGTCGATLNLNYASNIDDCAAGYLTLDNDAFEQFGTGDDMADISGNYPAGTHTITFTAQDPCGNATTHMLTMVVNDNETPTALCSLSGQQVVLNSSGNASITPAFVDNGSHDNCSIASLNVNPSTFDCSDLGTATTTLTVTDPTGNFNSCTISVEVIENSPPSITCPADISIDCADDIDNYGITGFPTSSSACGAATIVTPPTDNTIGSSLHCRTVMRIWVAINGTSNSASCLQTIDVSDNDAPTLSAPPADITITCLGPVPSAVTLTAVDNCATNLAINFSETSTKGSDPTMCSFYNYTITRTWSVNDECSNTTTDNRTIKVDNDTPVVNITDPMLINNDATICGATVTVNLLDFISDCTDDALLSVSNTALADYGTGNGTDNINGFYTPGDYPITVLVTDPCGATSTQTFTLEIRDAETPNPVCDSDLIVVLDNTGNGSLTAANVDEGSSDNCGVASLSISPSTFTTADIGVVNVTLTVTDIYGNTSTCVSAVTVTGNATIYAGGSITTTSGSTITIPVTADLFENLIGFSFTWHLDNTPNNIGDITGNISNINPLLSGFSVGNITTNIATNTITAAWVNPTPITLPDGAILFEIEVTIDAGAINGDNSTLTIDASPTPLQILQDHGSGPVSSTPLSAGGTVTIDNTSVPVTLDGTLTLPGSATGVSLINVMLSGTSTGSQTTDGTGTYSFMVTPGSTAVIDPDKDINPANGVTIFDMQKIQGHITFDPSATLATDCEKIAADVTRDGSIDIFDLFEVQSVILGGNFSVADSWEFAVGDCSAATTTGHLVTPAFVEAISYSAVQTLTDQTGNFTAIKMGNVSDLGGADNPNPANLIAADDRTGDAFYLVTNDLALESDVLYEIPVRAKNFNQINGFQHTFEFDTEVLSFENLLIQELPNAGANNFGLSTAAEGKITLAWIGSANDWEEEDILFTLRFTANATATLSEVLSITSSITPELATNINAEALDVEIEFESFTSVNPNTNLPAFQLLQNRPNPFDNQTIIGFVLPAQNVVSLKITNISGQVIQLIENNYSAGYHEIKVDNLISSGIYYYELKTANHTATKKMIFID